jgi:hypothetical protein
LGRSTLCWARLIVSGAGGRVNQALWVELWTSWASMLRVYAAAHGLTSDFHAVVEVGAEEIVLRVDSRWVRFTREWMTDSEDKRLAFALEEDGQ